jgi:hypothetical protein
LKVETQRPKTQNSRIRAYRRKLIHGGLRRVTGRLNSLLEEIWVIRDAGSPSIGLDSGEKVLFGEPKTFRERNADADWGARAAVSCPPALN